MSEIISLGPLVDRRLMEAFLESNGYKISPSVAESYEFPIGVASGRVPEAEVEDWIARHLTELREK